MSIGPVTAQGTARVRMNFANTHLASAHHFAMLVRDLEKANAGAPFGGFIEGIMRNTTAAIMMAAASLEAYVNEIHFEPEAHFPKQRPADVAAVLGSVEREPLLNRVCVLCALNEVQMPGLGRNPGQSVKTLIQVRNALVHFRPEWPGEGKKTPHAKLSKRLANHGFALSPFFPPTEPVFPRACMSYGCARWAVEAVRDFIVELADASGWNCGIRKMLPRLVLPP